MVAPLIISTWSFGQRGNSVAWPALEMGGSSLDAVEKACIAVENDPEVDSVGFGGLPDCTGRVSLDGCIMQSPARSGSVCAVRKYMNPVSIARRVMERTNHFMLVGEGAEAFAAEQGFIEADLLSSDAQDAYVKWKQQPGAVDQSRDRRSAPQPPRPIDMGPHGGGRLFLHPAPEDCDEQRWKHHDTIGVLALDRKGVLAGACSTSGTPYKLAGRVGDSPIIGHGLYVDPVHGAAVATGTGELIMGICGSFLVVELMRRGASPIDAVSLALRRISEEGFSLKPEHQVAFIALRADGQFASAALRPGYKTSIRTRERDDIIDPDEVMIDESQERRSAMTPLPELPDQD